MSDGGINTQETRKTGWMNNKNTNDTPSQMVRKVEKHSSCPRVQSMGVHFQASGLSVYPCAGVKPRARGRVMAVMVPRSAPREAHCTDTVRAEIAGACAVLYIQ